MAVKISLIKSPPGQPLAPGHKRFGSRGGVIGRSADNDWQLPDPERFLSGKHCQVLFVDGRCVLKDHSTNGTFVNGAAEPVGRGREVTLKDGDTFDVGEYRFRVTLEAAELIVPEKPFNEAAVDATALPVKPGPAQALAPATSSRPVGTDPMAEFDELLAIKPKPSTPQPRAKAPECDVLEQALDWPVAPSAHAALPEDWADDISLLGERSAPKSRYTLPDDDSLIVSRAVPTQAVVKPAPPRMVTPITPGRVTPPAAPVRQRQPAAVTAPVRAPAASADGHAGEGAKLASALKLKTPLPTDAEARLPETCGAMLRETLTGLMQVLRSRASIKNEFRMNVTTIQPVENNPIKFSATADEALDLMFARPSKAYKDPVAAIEESFDSIADHQVAVIAGIRSAFRALLTEFDPAAMEEKFEKSRRRGIFGLSNAKRWRAYEDHYRDLTDNLERSFQELFGEEFVQAYEDQLRKLSALRRREQPKRK